MAIIDVLKYDGPNNVLVWKWRPQERGKKRFELLGSQRDYDLRQEQLRFGTQLVVNQSQIAVFVKNGQIADIFSAGRYTLSSKNLPILDKLIALPFGRETPFKAEVYYINKSVVMDTQFTLPPFNMLEPNFRVPIPIKAGGSFAVRVGEARQFLSRIIGTMPDLEANQLKEYFRGVITENVKAAITRIAREQKISPLELEATVAEVADSVKATIAETLEKYGLKLELFNIEGVSIVDDDPRVQKVVADYQRLMSEDIQERLRLKRRAENIDVFKVERTFDTTEKAAENIGGSDGGSGGILGTMVGLGMVNPLGNAMAGIMSNVMPAEQQSQQQPQAAQADKDAILKMLKELGELKTAGILTEDEFAEKKKELLSKI
ncbi:MAG: SPFH domain-containing protein [Prevotellaceae bacterium]|jgi:membrane protease subunit (stomatin/prohibitin family)|nr:SPFH domain-containing protein [Prevotellaceae bacterium]